MLNLGWGDAAPNLRPQAPITRGTGSAEVKDRLENHLRVAGAAQTAMAGDRWAAVPSVRRPRPSATAPTPPSTGQGIHGASFCAPAGATGHTLAGTAMVSKTTANSPTRVRCHRA